MLAGTGGCSPTGGWPVGRGIVVNLSTCDLAALVQAWSEHVFTTQACFLSGVSPGGSYVVKSVTEASNGPMIAEFWAMGSLPSSSCLR